eukprot:scaffold84740_cov75-Phaeocystis_antarctica.AAC.3
MPRARSRPTRLAHGATAMRRERCCRARPPSRPGCKWRRRACPTPSVVALAFCCIEVRPHPLCTRLEEWQWQQALGRGRRVRLAEPRRVLGPVDIEHALTKRRPGRVVVFPAEQAGSAAHVVVVLHVHVQPVLVALGRPAEHNTLTSERREAVHEVRLTASWYVLAHLEGHDPIPRPVGHRLRHARVEICKAHEPPRRLLNALGAIQTDPFHSRRVRLQVFAVVAEAAAEVEHRYFACCQALG